MLLNQFLNKCSEQQWLGPEETKNGYLKIAKPYKIPKVYKYYKDNGRLRSSTYLYYRYDYYQFYNCCICGELSVGKQAKVRNGKDLIIGLLCERTKDSYCNKEYTRKMYEKGFINGNKSNSSPQNPTVNKWGYPGFYGDKIKDNSSHFIPMHRYVAEKEILFRPLKKGEVVHHINMKRNKYHKDNLFVCNAKTHALAHGSYNELCDELMHNYHKYSGMDFNKETGKYYLIERNSK